MENLNHNRMMHAAAYGGYGMDPAAVAAASAAAAAIHGQHSSSLQQHHHQQQDHGVVGQGSSSGGGSQQQQHTEGVRGHADISTILDQILTIPDQSLDEAQVNRFLKT